MLSAKRVNVGEGDASMLVVGEAFELGVTVDEDVARLLIALNVRRQRDRL